MHIACDVHDLEATHLATKLLSKDMIDMHASTSSSCVEAKALPTCITEGLYHGTLFI